MNTHHSKRQLIIFSIAVFVFLVGIGWLGAARNGAAAHENTISAPNITSLTYLPVLYKEYPWLNLFGVESNSSFFDGNIFTNYAIDLQSGYVRLNGRISWRALQPNEGDPINWDLLVFFENELRTLREANIRPIVIVDDYPRWATDNSVRDDGQPTSCGPLLPERYDDFAVFMQALVTRYMQDEFNVHIWELGNEPDVDPNLVEPDSVYGCWGDWDKLTYNGDAYGQMLMTVTPVIKATDPRAQVWVGGLLVGSPNTNDPYHIGRPELFLQGILDAGAGPYFDVLPYHAYLSWYGGTQDMDIFSGSLWDSWGGIMRGKGAFLRSIMSQYGVDKPLFINETGMICRICGQSLNDEFFDLQANLVARSYPRAMAEDITGFVWYTLDGPGWRLGGLLDENQQPKPVYNAYHTFMDQIYGTIFIGPASYGNDIEAYSFGDSPQRTDIVFSIQDVTYTILVPQTEFIAAYDRFGSPITPTPIGSDYQLTIQFEPIYILRTR
jgi:hypothetical protein